MRKCTVKTMRSRNPRLEDGDLLTVCMHIIVILALLFVSIFIHVSLDVFFIGVLIYVVVTFSYSVFIASVFRRRPVVRLDARRRRDFDPNEEYTPTEGVEMVSQ